MKGEIGRFRRHHLNPVPAVASLAVLNPLITAGDVIDDRRVITGRPVTIAAEQPAMLPLPAEPFDPARLCRPGWTADPGLRAAELLLHPGPLCRPAAAVRLSATAVEVLNGPRRLARHERGRHARRDPGPGPLSGNPAWKPGATALAQARAADTFTAAHQRHRDADRRQHGNAAGTRALIEVLLAHRTLPAAALTAAMTKAIGSGVLNIQAVLIHAAARRAVRSHRSSRSAPWPAMVGRLPPWTPTTSC